MTISPVSTYIVFTTVLGSGLGVLYALDHNNPAGRNYPDPTGAQKC